MFRQLPNIRKTTFWDADINAINYDKNFEWVVCRVFDRGTLKEVVGIIHYYGWDFVKDIITKTEINLLENAIDLAKGIFQLKDSDFKCLEKTPFPPPYKTH